MGGGGGLVERMYEDCLPRMICAPGEGKDIKITPELALLH